MEKNRDQNVPAQAVATVVDAAVPDAATPVVRLEGTRLGDIDVPENLVIEFPEGILGFPDSKRYVIVQHPSGGPFQWLQSVDDPGLAFVAGDPAEFFDNYDLTIAPEQLNAIKATSLEEIVVIVLLVVPQDPKKITANLQGPVLINRNARIGQQLVIQSQGYSTRQPIFSATTGDVSKEAAIDAVGSASASGGE